LPLSGKISFNWFSAATCASGKILLGLQTWEFCSPWVRHCHAPPVHDARLPSALLTTAPHFSIKTPSPQPSCCATGGLLLIRFFQWTVTYFLRFALGIRLNCLASRFFKLRTSLIVSFATHYYYTILGPTLTQACLERIKSTLHFAFPNSEKFGCLFGPLFFTGPYLLSTWDSPFLSDCILLYFSLSVNIFLAVLHKKFAHTCGGMGKFVCYFQVASWYQLFPVASPPPQVDSSSPSSPQVRYQNT